MQSVLKVVAVVFVCAVIAPAVTPTRLMADDAVERDERPTSPLPLPSPLWLPKVFGNHMVLQRDRPLPIWGRSTPSDVLVVSLAKTVVETKADAQGHWRLTLPPQPSGGPHQLTVRGTEHQRTIEDVMLGEVWVCSGQSNMELSVKEALHPREEISAAKYPKIRFFNVANAIAKEPQTDCDGRWCACSPNTVGDFSAVAYFFGRELHEHLDQPIGLIDASWGGSLCEAWMSREALSADPDFEQILHRALGDNIGKGCGMYNAMIHPLIPFAIRGVIWYQGESNASRAWQYQKLFPSLIRDWRSKWGQGDFPFYYVQLAPLDRHADEWVELWEAQLKTLAVPNTGMAVITDLDEPGLHPLNKQGVGRRLSLWALAKDYGHSKIVYSGPLYKSMQIDGQAIRLQFDHAAGLTARDGKPLSDFTIAGNDRKFYPAIATIMEETIIVQSDDVPQPVAVRFGWTDTAQPNLINGAALPASPFRTDDWPAVTSNRN
jgi:sialate O-acetylesterase